MEIVISESKKVGSKFDARIDGKKTVSFGLLKGASDYVKHQVQQRTYAYSARHKQNEDWTKSGVKAAGFWSIYILCNTPTLQASVADINNTFKTYKCQHEIV